MAMTMFRSLGQCRTIFSGLIAYKPKKTGFSNQLQPAWVVQQRSLSSSTTTSKATSVPLKIYEPVQQALADNKPVVALESTILSHGLPFPENVQLAERLAMILRDQGVEPATIAVKNGTCHVGLSVEELHDLAQARSESRIVKCSSREIPLFLARHGHNVNADQPAQWGATTVASTMRIAHMAGIETFVTGGIGGVHRDGENSMDISADLTELGRTPVIVISAGIKSILDISRTLEVLETNAVPVVSWKTNEFPAFFSARSGVQSPERVDSAEEVALAYQAARDIGLASGMLVAVPNNDDPAGASVEAAIQTALQEASAKGIAGQAVTPYILRRVAELTEGESVRSNLALVQQNARVGAEIAIAIANKKLQRKQSAQVAVKNTVQQPGARSQVVVLGGILLDIIAKPDEELITKTSNPAKCSESDGGVARNIAEVLGRLGSKPLLYSAVGNDARGMALLDRLENECGVTSVKQTVKVIDKASTATYLAVLDGQGDMHVACADMSIFEILPSPPDDILKASALLVVDANPSLDTLREVVQRARMYGVGVFFEPTSVPKAMLVARDPVIMSCLTHMSPNLDELLAMSLERKLRSDKEIALLKTEPDLKTIRALSSRLLERMDPNEAHIVVTLGDRGALLTSQIAGQEPTVQYYPAQEVAVLNATGAGDSFTGAVVHSLLNRNRMAKAVEAGMEAAVLSLQCPDRAISPQIGRK